MNKQPNIVFILLDNLGYGELGCYGGGQLRGAPTPRIDALAAEGMRLTNMNMEAQCTPSRSAVMTGRMPVRSGTTVIPQPETPSGLVTWEVTIAQLLSRQGYATAHYGKWHLGDQPARQPHQRGFDEWWGLLETHDSSLWEDAPGFAGSQVQQEQLWHGVSGEPSVSDGPYGTTERSHFDAEVFIRATDFITRASSNKQPFFAYLPIAFPHFPALPHPDFAGVTGNGDFADAFVEIDTRIGALVDHLSTLGLSDDTMIFLTSDNGAEDTLPWRGWTGPWGGSYFTAMEGSLRVPCIVRWPNQVPAGVVSNEICHAVDIFTTFAELGGAQIPTDRPIDGINLLPFLTAKQAHSGREAVLCFVADHLHAVKWRNWKLHFIWQEYMLDPPVTLGVPRAFNLYEDPRERHDIFLPSNTWVRRPVAKAISQYEASIAEFPKIAPGTLDPYLP